MTLATHIAIAGVAARSLVAVHPGLAVAAAIASHYLLDAIPHWDYSLRSLAPENRHWKFSRASLRADLGRVILDGMIGISLLILLLWPRVLTDFLIIGLLTMGAILPDLLQGIYYTKKADFLKPLQCFHDWFHSKIQLGPYPAIGVPLQLILLTLILSLLS